MVRQLAASFVAVPPSGTSAQTRLEVTEAEDATLWELYRFGGRLRASDLRLLVEMNAAGGADDAESRKALAASRKRNMTPLWSSRVAGAVYRDNDEMWALSKHNLEAHIDTLDERIAAIEDRLEIPVGAKGGYRNQRTANAKRYRLECARRPRDKVRAKLDANRPSICLGGKDLARNRHNLAEAGMTLDQWRLRHDAARGWLAVNGTSGEVLGNQTLRVDPDSGLLELLLPAHLAHLSNTAGPRPSWRLEAQVGFEHLREEWEERVRSRRAVSCRLSTSRRRVARAMSCWPRPPAEMRDCSHRGCGPIRQLREDCSKTDGGAYGPNGCAALAPGSVACPRSQGRNLRGSGSGQCW